MERFHAAAVTHSGQTLALIPQSLSLTRSLSSPAQSLRAVFPLDRWPPEVKKLTLMRDGAAILDVRPDQQTASFSEDGMLLEVAARTKGAALLDNEARPATYVNVTAQALFNELIAPYGFVLLHSPGPVLPEFTVRKGWTLWDTFSAFTRRVYGLVPYVENDMVKAMRPSPGNPIMVGGPDLPVIRLERVIDHYEPLSRVYIRDEEGQYTASVGNQDAVDRDIKRVRYMIPAGEFAAAPAWDATQRIRRGMRKMLAVKVTVPGWLEALPGKGVWVDHPQLIQPNLLVDEVTFTLDPGGARTTLTLRSALYY